MVTEKDFIRPCPFCGGFAEFEEHRDCIGHDEYIISSFIRCKRCGATAHPTTDREVADREERKQKVLEYWNYRYKDLIDRQRKMVLMSLYGTMSDKIRKEIKADIKRFNNITEVVRCKDCDWFKTHCGDVKHNHCTHPHWDDSEGWCRDVEPDDFCSYGERKDNAKC